MFTYILSRKKIFIPILIVLIVVAGLIIRSRGKDSGILTGKAERKDLKQTVLATGQVVSAIDLSLSFQSSGVVSRVFVKVGDKVRNGQILATLNQRDQLASLTQSRGTLAQAQASYNKLIAGSSVPDIKVSQAAVNAAQITLDNARSAYDAAVNQQKVLVDNAKKAMLNSGLDAIRQGIFDSNFTATISGTYNSTEQGEYKITMLSTGNQNFYYQVNGLEVYSGTITRGIPLPLGTRGLYITFSIAGTISAIDSWTAPIPNTLSSTYLTALNAYNAAIETQNQTLTGLLNTVNSAKVNLEQAVAALNLKIASARQEDLDAADAQILTASGQVQAAEAALEKTVIRSPADGTITGVDIKVGELATALTPVLVLQDVGNLRIEANISEANVTNIIPGQVVEVTYDALGLDEKYTAKVEFVDPASTVVSGVVNYKVTFSIDDLAEIKPGMTANLSVVTAEIKNALAIPSRAVVSRNGGKFVQVVQDSKKKTWKEQKVETGLEADGGLIEVKSGLDEGTEIITFMPK